MFWDLHFQQKLSLPHWTKPVGMWQLKNVPGPSASTSMDLALTAAVLNGFWLPGSLPCCVALRDGQTPSSSLVLSFFSKVGPGTTCFLLLTTCPSHLDPTAWSRTTWRTAGTWAVMQRVPTWTLGLHRKVVPAIPRPLSPRGKAGCTGAHFSQMHCYPQPSFTLALKSGVSHCA